MVRGEDRQALGWQLGEEAFGDRFHGIVLPQLLHVASNELAS